MEIFGIHKRKSTSEYIASILWCIVVAYLITIGLVLGAELLGMPLYNNQGVIVALFLAVAILYGNFRSKVPRSSDSISAKSRIFGLVVVIGLLMLLITIFYSVILPSMKRSEPFSTGGLIG